ncbi:MAG: hypothetical protein ACT4PV_09630 [Planctomycetaceae bacterium]
MKRLLLLVLLAACGKAAGGKTPRETVAQLQAALKKGDGGALYDLLTTRAQRQLDGQIQGISKVVPRFEGCDGRELLVELFDMAKETAPQQFEMLAATHMVVMETKTQGDSARLKVSILGRNRDETVEMRLAREHGRWKLDDGGALGGAQLAAGMQAAAQEAAACTTFT